MDPMRGGTTILGSLATLALGVLLVGLGCQSIYWFFWSQASHVPDIGLCLLLGSFLIVVGKRVIVLAFDVAGDARPIGTKDIAVIVAAVLVFTPVVAWPWLADAIAQGRAWLRVRPTLVESTTSAPDTEEHRVGLSRSRYSERGSELMATDDGDLREAAPTSTSSRTGQ